MAEQCACKELEAKVAELEAEIRSLRKQLRVYQQDALPVDKVPNSQLMPLADEVYARYSAFMDEWNHRIATGKMEMPCPTEFLDYP